MLESEESLSNPQSLSECVLRWADEGVGMRASLPDGRLPSSRDIRMICRGPMMHILRFLVTSTRDEAYVRTAKKNLLLFGAASDRLRREEEDALQTILREKSELHAHLLELEKSSSGVQEEIRHLVAQIETASREGRREMGRADAHKEEGLMFSAYLHRMGRIDTILREYAARFAAVKKIAHGQSSSRVMDARKCAKLSCESLYETISSHDDRTESIIHDRADHVQSLQKKALEQISKKIRRLDEKRRRKEKRMAMIERIGDLGDGKVDVVSDDDDDDEQEEEEEEIMNEYDDDVVDGKDGCIKDTRPHAEDEENGHVSGIHLREGTTGALERAGLTFGTQLWVDGVDDYTQEVTRAVEESITHFKTVRETVLEQLRLKRGELGIHGGGHRRNALGGAETRTVEELLEILRNDHLKLYFETQELLNEVHRLQSESQSGFQGGNETRGKRPEDSKGIRKRAIDMKLDACTRVLRQSIEEMKARREAFRHDGDTLSSQMAKIQESESEKNLLHENIQKKIEQIDILRRRLLAMRDEVYFQSRLHLKPMVEDTNILLAKFKRELQTEWKSFCDIPLSHFRPTSHHVSERSSRDPRVTGSLEDAHEQSFVEELTSSMSYPHYLSSDGLLPHIADLKRKVGKQLQQSGASPSLSSSDVQQEEALLDGTIHPGRLASTLQKLETTQSEMKMRLKPFLESQKEVGSRGVEECVRLREAAHAWVSEPAQECIPFVKVDGKTLPEWRQMFNTLEIQAQRQSGADEKEATAHIKG